MSIWKTIPLSDYENHMSDSSVQQLNALAGIFGKKLKLYQPESVMIWGIAGGNGLENIDTNVTNKVIGIDINNKYLEACRERYNEKIRNLNLHCCDLNADPLPQYKTNFIWAALILEYIDMDKAFAHADRCLEKEGVISFLIQKDNGHQSVRSQFDSINNIASIFQKTDNNQIKDQARNNEYQLISEKEYFLESGKSFVVIDLKR